MCRSPFLLAVAAVAAGSAYAQIQQPAPAYFSVPAPDAPELARRGQYAVGVRSLELVHPQQPDVLAIDKQTGKAPRTDRKLTVEVWYPATLPPGANESVIYTAAMPGRPDNGTFRPGRSFEVAGKAARDAPPVSNQKFPLVIVSHGYPGSRFFLTYLTENLASKGYVVAAIDHTDSVFGDVRPFPSTLLNRSADQWFTAESLLRMSSEAGFLRNLVDADKVAMAGYSMGGYGALISAGAGISSTSPLLKFVNGGYLANWSNENASYRAIKRNALKAIVAIAPWGNQPPYKAWNAEGLANIRVPSLFIAGDHDDVADFDNGIKPAFDAAIHSERYLLVFKDARHNTGGDPPPPGVSLDYGLIQTFDEPVWRKDRITAINQHFITAFLDVYLKGDASKRAYLELAPAASDEGHWKVPAGARDDGAFSSGRDAEGSFFWKGFQRRWALGLDWLSRKASN